MANKNNNKIILDLCGGTGAWSKPYQDAEAVYGNDPNYQLTIIT